jgi:hypothetical protein
MSPHGHHAQGEWQAHREGQGKIADAAAAGRKDRPFTTVVIDGTIHTVEKNLLKLLRDGCVLFS